MGTDRISDLTVDEFRTLIRETVREVLEELVETDDPDDELEFKPEVADYLKEALRERKRGTPLQDVIHKIGLDETKR
jgi:hypothetical protein